MKTRPLLIPALVLALAALPVEAQGQKSKSKKKSKSSSTSQSQTQSDPTADLLAGVEAKLLVWDTAGARQLHGQLPSADSVAARVAAGRVLAQEKRYDESAAQLRTAADAAAGDPWPVIYLGETHLLAERADDARRAFEQAAQRAAAGLAATPQEPELLLALGTARQRLRQLPEAVAALEQSRRLSPSAEAAYQLGLTRSLMREWQPAVQLLTEAIERNPELAYAYYYRALAAEKINRKDLLINDLNRFLALAPEAPDAGRARRILDSIR